MGDKVVLCERDGGQGGYLARLHAQVGGSSQSGHINDEGVWTVRSAIRVSKTRPEPGGTHQVHAENFVVSGPDGIVDVGFGGIYGQAREVCIKKFQPPPNSRVVLADLVEIFQGPIIGEDTEGNRENIHPETLDHLNDRSSLMFENGSTVLRHFT